MGSKGEFATECRECSVRLQSGYRTPVNSVTELDTGRSGRSVSVLWHAG
jgi:hypothetical protein